MLGSLKERNNDEMGQQMIKLEDPILIKNQFREITQIQSKKIIIIVVNEGYI